MEIYRGKRAGAHCGWRPLRVAPSEGAPGAGASPRATVGAFSPQEESQIAKSGSS